MVKVLGAVALLCLGFMVACSKDEIKLANDVNDNGRRAVVTVSVDDFSITQEPFDDGGNVRRASKDGIAVADYSGVKAITLAFFASDGSQQYCATQLRNDNSTYTTFGQFVISMPLGSYTMVVLGYGSEQPLTLNNATEAVYTADRVRETFVKTQAVNITSSDALSFTATLSRVVSKVLVRSTDVRPAMVDSVRITFSAGGKGVNPATGLATSNGGFSNSVALTSAVGSIAGTVNYLFLASDQQAVTITVDALKSDGTMVSHRVVSDVPLQRNRVTVMRGSLFSTDGSADFSVEPGYEADTNFVDF